MLKKVISGGQTGVDQLALRAARKLGIETGGTAPLLWMTEIGPAPWLKEFGLVECTARGYPPCTYENVKNSKGTVLFGDMKSDGSISTIKFCKSADKPYLCNPSAEELAWWILANKIDVLNVAGNRQSKLTAQQTVEIVAIMVEGFALAQAA